MAPPGRRRRLPVLFIALPLLIFASTASAASAVLGVDLGTEFIKAALVKPGIPLEIVLTKDSKRKEAAAVAFKPVTGSAAFPERLYGGDALALAGRYPAHVYSNLKPLLAIPDADLATKEAFSERRPALDMTPYKPRGTWSFKSSAFQKEQGPFLVEEILAMELQNIRANAEALAGKGSSIRDIVITVPPFFTVDEKRAVELAADLAGLRVLGMVTDGLAVGINYATSRTFPSISDGASPECHLIFDMGAGSTSATILRFQGRDVKGVGRLNKTIQEVNVLGTGWDRTLGGDALNAIVIDHMVEEFVATPKAKTLGFEAKAVKSHGRTAAKLWKEAERVRQVLSANIETVASFEGLYEDVDFRYKLTRARLDDMISSRAEQIDQPIKSALEVANMTMADLDSVILHGGAARTPFVQKRLEKLVGDAGKVRTNVNADEAAVFGAAFKGAGLSPSFRVKEIRTGDNAGYAVAVEWKSDDKDRRQKIFIPSSQTGAEKQVPFKSLQDFSFSLSQSIPSTEASSTDRKAPILKIQTQNLTKSVAQLGDKFGCAPTDISTKFAIRLNPTTGLPEVVQGTVSCEVEGTDKKGGVVDGVKGLFGFGSQKDDQKPLADGDQETDEQVSMEEADVTSSTSASTSSGKTGSSSSAAASASDRAVETPNKRLETVHLDFTVQPQGIPEPSAAEVKRMKKRLADFVASDASRRLREEAVNTLEAFTYRSRDLLSEDSFIRVSTESEREKLDTELQAASEWLYGDGADASKDALKARLKGLKDLVNPIDKRRQEATKRPEEVRLLEEALNQTKALISVVKEQVDVASRATLSASSESTATTSSAVDDDFADLDDFPTSSTTTSSSKPTKSAEPPIYTSEDVSSLTSIYDSVNEWLTSKLAEQDKLSPKDDPVIWSTDIANKAKKLNKAVMDLLQKKPRVPPKPKSTGKSSSKSKKTKTKSGGSSTLATEEEEASAVFAEMPTFNLEDGEDMPTEEEMMAAVERAKKKVAADGEARRHDPNEL